MDLKDVRVKLVYGYKLIIWIENILSINNECIL